MQRRRFNAWLAGAAGSAALGRLGALGAQQPSTVRADIYANVGPRLLRYRIADDGQSLVEIGQPIVVAEEIQEACQWGRHFYVASSDEHTAANPQNHYLERLRSRFVGSARAARRCSPLAPSADPHHGRPSGRACACRLQRSEQHRRSSLERRRLDRRRSSATSDARYRSLCPSNSRHALRPCRDPACARQSGDSRAKGRRISVASRYSTTPTVSSRISSP